MSLLLLWMDRMKLRFGVLAMLRSGAACCRASRPEGIDGTLLLLWSADCTMTSDGVVSPDACCDLLSRLRSKVRTEIYALENHTHRGPTHTYTHIQQYSVLTSVVVLFIVSR